MSGPNGSDFAALGIYVRMDGPVEQRSPCPKCDRGAPDDALAVNVEDGLYFCHRCGWKGRVGGKVTEPRAPRQVHKADSSEAAKAKERVQRVWDASAPLTANTQGTRAVRNYLEVRGLESVLNDPPACLRAHSALAYWEDGKQAGIFPAMVAQFHGNNASVVTLHQTFLRPDGGGKAPVRSPKKLLPVQVSGATRGGAIRLYVQTKDRVLGVAEGIESALSLRLLLGIPVWSTYCAAGLGGVYLPFLSRVFVGVDIDESGAGEAAANALVQSLRGWPKPPRVTLVRPEGEGPRDLNDELMARRSARQCLN